MARPRGLEPPTSSVTGKRSNQLSYDPENLTTDYIIFPMSLALAYADTHALMFVVYCIIDYNTYT